jgi:hypothetical protein
MGFFSKIFKSVGKVFKKIGKGIKSAFTKFGKFMGKIGVLGQVAMFFVMPYIGQALGAMWTGVAGQTAAQATATATANAATAAAGAQAGASAAAIEAGKVASAKLAEGVATKTLTKTVVDGVATYASKATGLMAKQGIAQSAGKLMQFVGNTVSKGFNVYSNITKGVTETLGNFAKTASNKMFGTSFDAASNFFTGGDTAFSRSFGKNSRFANLTSSESVFEQFEEERIAKTEAALATPKGKKAMVEAVAESGGDSRAYGQTDFIADPNIEQAIGRGDTNLTASLDPTIQDPTGVINDASKYEVGSIQYADAQFKNMANKSQSLSFDEYAIDGLTNYQTPVSERVFSEPSLLDRLKTGIKSAPAQAYKKAGEIADDPVGYVFNKTEESLQDQLNLRVGQELGISEKPEYNVQNISNVAFVPSMDSFSSSQSQYGAQEIMSARAFEQQVTLNPNPYGYTAFQYGNYMSQLAQTA